MKDDRVYLQHILDAIDRIRLYTKGGESTFLGDTMIQDAVIRNLEIIGEAARQVSPAVRAESGDVPWAQITALRNVLVHNYMGVDIARVWQVVAQRLPELETRIRSLLG